MNGSHRTTAPSSKSADQAKTFGRPLFGFVQEELETEPNNNAGTLAAALSRPQALPYDSSENMTTMTFDKLAYVDRLKAAGFEDDKARAMAEGLDVALREEIVTKPELRAQLAEFKTEMKADIATLRGEFGVVKWMAGFTLAILVAIGFKVFLT